MPITTVDVWDTLLRRKCHPDEVKLGAAGYVTLKYWPFLLPSYREQRMLHDLRHASEVEIGKRRIREGLDDEYEFGEVWARTMRIAAPELSDNRRTEIVADICDHEFRLEQDVTYPDPSIGKTLREFAGGDDLWFLSDFYMKSDRLGALIRHHHPDLDFKGGLVSCEAGVNKRSGKLFTVFADQHGGAAGRKHIGDQATSDVSTPSAQGIRCLHFVNQPEEKRRSQLAHQFARRMSGDHYDIWRELTRSAKSKRLKQAFDAAAANFNTGTELAPVFVLYTIFAIEQALRHQVDTVYYFTREGEILSRIHQAIADCLPDMTLPVAKVLEVSRIATFGPSIGKLDLDELNRLWTMYPNQSMRAFLASLGAEPADFADHLAPYGLDMDEIVSQPWKDARFRRLMEDTGFRNALEGDIERRRQLLLGYLAQHGIAADSRNIVIVDIGWRGTIQDNLARLLPGVHWHGVYLALFKFLNKQPANVSKAAFIFDCNEGSDGEEDVTPQAAVEMLFNSEAGSTIGYRDGPDGIIAKRMADEEENAVYASFTQAFQEGILAAAPAIATYVRSRGLLSTDLRLYVRKAIKQLLKDPPPRLAKAYFRLSHNETFGNGTFVKQIGGLRFGRAIGKIAPGAVIRDIDRQAAESGWLGGFFSANRLRGVKRTLRSISNGNTLLKLGMQVARKSLKHGFAPVVADLREALNKPRDMTSDVRSGPEIQPLLRILGDIDITDPAALGFNARHAHLRQTNSERIVMSWIVPDIRAGSGGHMTILRFVKYFQELGFQCRIYIHERSEHGSPEDLRAFIETHYTAIPGVEVHSSIDDVRDTDILIATLWITAYDVFARTNARFKAYFIQDYEPYFYARGSDSVFAENTYRFNFFGIAASPWLQRIATADYGMQSCFFNLGYDPAVYHPDPVVERDPDRIAVYLRPSTPRRGTELLIATLALVKARRPQTKIAIFGTRDLGYRDVPFRAEILGLQTEEQLRSQHSASAITLLCSLTNYSLLPIEAAACGSVIVDLSVDSMKTTFGEDTPIVLAPPDPRGLADAILALLNDPAELARRSGASIDFARTFTWEAAFADVANGLAHAYFGAPQVLPDLPDGTLIRALGGERVFSVKSGLRYPVKPAENGFDVEDVMEIPVGALVTIPDAGPTANQDRKISAP